MGGIIDSCDGVPLGTTPDKIYISKLEKRVGDLEKAIKQYLNLSSATNKQELLKLVNPKSSYREPNIPWKSGWIKN